MGATTEGLVTDITFPAFTLLLLLSEKLLEVVRMKSLDVSAESLLAGMKLVAEGTFVLFPLDGRITVMFLLVHSEV